MPTKPQEESSKPDERLAAVPAAICTRRRALKAITALGAAPLLAGASSLPGQTVDPTEAAQGANVAPTGQSIAIGGYRLEFTHSIADLVGDMAQTERGDPRRQSSMPYSEWYSERTRRRSGSWGPHPRHYPPLAGLSDAPVAWQRERVVATAARFIGYAYQHHHIPDWDPPASWPWKQCCAGHNGKGVDCSNLTSFVFNQGFGIRFSAAIRQQAERDRALESPHDSISLRTIELPKDYARRQQALRTGDLVYIRGRVGGPITHVVIWVGSIGRSPSGAPLVLDSHGADVHDDAGQAIPCGIQLRPFRQDSWYNRCASHAHRVFGNRKG